MRKNKNRSGSKSFLATHIRAITLWITVLGTAAVGTYLLASSSAYDANRPAKLRVSIEEWTAKAMRDGNGFLYPPGTTSKSRLTATGYPDPSPTSPAYRGVFFVSYDTKYLKFVSGNCDWQHGCTASFWNGTSVLIYETEPLDTHKKRILVCFNIPANARFENVPLYTFNFQRTAIAADYTASFGAFVGAYGYDRGICDSKSTSGGVLWMEGGGGCSSRGCDDGTGPGAGNGIFPGSGTGPGDGDGSGGTGTGTAGRGQGSGPGTGSGSAGSGGTGGAGGGSSATTQADKPNDIPSSSSQGKDDKQPKLEPSPFFDGKLFAVGSDFDEQDVQGVSVAGRKFGYGWVYLLGGFLVLAAALLAGYFWWWRKLPVAKQGRWKARLGLK